MQGFDIIHHLYNKAAVQALQGKQFMRKLSLEMQRSEQSKEEVLEKQALLLVNQKGRP